MPVIATTPRGFGDFGPATVVKIPVAQICAIAAERELDAASAASGKHAATSTHQASQITIRRHQELILERDKAMKKISVKKLNLNRDTLRALIPTKLELARGGTGVASNFTNCICTLGEDCVTGLCISDACPTALCA